MNESRQERESRLRGTILEIQRDASLSPIDKSRRIQEIMSNSPLSNTSSLREISPRAISDSYEIPDDILKAVGEEDKKLGCKHYQTNCMVRAECCGQWFWCRLCHDEAVKGHLIDRFSIGHMLCMLCKTPQKKSGNCSNCGESMAHYYCDICSLWENVANKNIYHCDDCGICRRGVRQDYTHCKRCNGCVSSKEFAKHKCHHASLHSNCPICGDNLFESTQPVIFMVCGHAIHHSCNQDYIQTSYQCPICMKSLSNMQDHFTRIEDLMTDQKMPEEYANVKSEILCNDCEQKSIVPYHFIYHRCSHCRSYNTNILRTINSEGDDEEQSIGSVHIEAVPLRDSPASSDFIEEQEQDNNQH